MESVNAVIIGAGVVGLSIAAALSRKLSSVYVLERNESFGQETSSRNSEVIHAGIYYPADSLKAKLCVEGNRRLYELCARWNIPHHSIGKLIIAVDEEEEKCLVELLNQGKKNGVPGLRIISNADIRKLEPHVCARAALYSPSTGIVNSHALMKYFVKSIKDNSGDVVYNAEVTKLNKLSQGYEVSLRDDFRFKSQVIINAAGLNADMVASMAGIDITAHNYYLKYCKGDYWRVRNNEKCSMVNRLIYPVPHKKNSGLGVHVTKDLGGSIRLGPDAYYVDRNNFDYRVDISKRNDFINSVSSFLPFFKDEDLIPDTSGIRPKLQGPGDDFRDFIIREETALGFPGFVNLIGIESPGLTASVSIADYVVEHLLK